MLCCGGRRSHTIHSTEPEWTTSPIASASLAPSASHDATRGWSGLETDAGAQACICPCIPDTLWIHSCFRLWSFAVIHCRGPSKDLEIAHEVWCVRAHQNASPLVLADSHGTLRSSAQAAKLILVDHFHCFGGLAATNAFLCIRLDITPVRATAPPIIVSTVVLSANPRATRNPPTAVRMWRTRAWAYSEFAFIFSFCLFVRLREVECSSRSSVSNYTQSIGPRISYYGAPAPPFDKL